ncbi:antibiotic biosynthesis monooxygenase family protein [Solimonas flava]|uniref:antibiotic biosynthesis monooxygenase family protein n=1 Tax=Solimonas flava TaxID=415849 RepID=UPI000421C9FD|nr:antibiotic biosynthesis monooxygenase family protein [Solimonas flava]
METPSPELESPELETPAPFIVVNTFTLKRGQLDAFIAAQRDGLLAMRGRIDGLLGSRLHRALERDQALLVSVFASRAAFERFRDGELFAAHRARLAPFIERTEPVFYAPAYAAGSV